jgi:hypothetical protein
MFDKKAYMKQYNRQHYQNQREWVKQHIDRVRASQRKSAKKCNWRLLNPDKAKVFHNASRRIPIGLQCEFCESTENLERHHHSYEFPDIIVTCCRACHQYLNRCRK